MDIVATFTVFTRKQAKWAAPRFFKPSCDLTFFAACRMKSFTLQRIPLPLQLLLLLGFLLSILWSLIFLDLHRLQQQTSEHHRAQMDNLARAFAGEVKSSVSAIDLTLIELREEWQSGYSDFAAAVRRRQSYLEQDIGFQVAIINAAGLLVFASTGTQPEAMDLSDREHFQVHRSLALGDRLFISKPVLGRVSQRWGIQFTRPLIDANGKFSGVIVLSVSPDYFSRFYTTIELGGNGQIALVRDSGELLAQSPNPSGALGKTLTGPPFSEEQQADHGWFESSGGTDGILRQYSWRALPQRDLLVMVGQSPETIYAPYRVQRRAYFLIGAGISLVLAWIGYAMLAGVRQRDLAAGALAESEARWKFALEGAAEGVWDWNIVRDQVQFSRRWKEILGYAEADIGDQVEEWHSRIHPDDRDETVLRTRRHLEGELPAYQSEHRMQCRDGSWKWVQERGMVVSRSDGGQPLRMVGTFSDISERKESERRDAERRQALDDTRKALQQAQKLEALGRLTGGIAHDFNNILQTLTTGIQLALLSATDKRPRSALEACQRAVERGVELTRQLLVFGRVQDAHLETVRPAQRIRDMRPLLQGALPSDIALHLDLPESLWPVRIDPLQFELALLNLVMNARDAMPDGGQLEIRGRNLCLDQAGHELEPGDYVHLLIADSGTGMSEEVLARALDPFYTTKAVGKGSGMGLAQAYGFARQAEGNLVLRNGDADGLEVSIYLPRTTQEPALAAPPAAAAMLPTRSGGAILLVEDDPLVSQTVLPALENAGYSVRLASNGDEALACLERGEAVDLVFSDIVMPGEISGIALAEIVRQRFPQVRMLLATGYSERRIALSGTRILAKPYAMPTLLAALNEELQASPSHLN
jgi:PAS domain S-box-containing protein